MDRSIWKFALDVTDEQEIEMPAGAKILCAQTQDGQPCIWALCDVNASKTTRRIVIHGTGHPCSEAAEKYVGTFQLRDGRLVFHVFDCGE